MIKITALCKVKEDCREAFLATAKILVDASRAEAGCISYGLYEDADDCAELIFIEEWASDEAIEEHCDSEHFQTAIPLLSDCCSEAMELRICKPLI